MLLEDRWEAFEQLQATELRASVYILERSCCLSLQ